MPAASALTWLRRAPPRARPASIEVPPADMPDLYATADAFAARAGILPVRVRVAATRDLAADWRDRAVTLSPLASLRADASPCPDAVDGQLALGVALLARARPPRRPSARPGQALACLTLVVMLTAQWPAVVASGALALAAEWRRRAILAAEAREMDEAAAGIGGAFLIVNLYGNWWRDDWRLRLRRLLTGQPLRRPWLDAIAERAGMARGRGG